MRASASIRRACDHDVNLAFDPFDTSLTIDEFRQSGEKTNVFSDSTFALAHSCNRKPLDHGSCLRIQRVTASQACTAPNSYVALPSTAGTPCKLRTLWRRQAINVLPHRLAHQARILLPCGRCRISHIALRSPAAAAIAIPLAHAAAAGEAKAHKLIEAHAAISVEVQLGHGLAELLRHAVVAAIKERGAQLCLQMVPSS